MLGTTTAGTFELFFDGSDVGLTTSDEDVDAFNVLNDGSFILSTAGSFSVPDASGLDEDLIRFVPSSTGANTAGTWSFYNDPANAEPDPAANGPDDVDVNADIVDEQGEEDAPNKIFLPVIQSQTEQNFKSKERSALYPPNPCHQRTDPSSV